jgi:hypothetical protein
VNESLVKYLAGLLDADGSLSFQFVNKDESNSYRVSLLIYLCASEGIDKNGFVKDLPNLTGFGGASAIQPKELVICGKPSKQRYTVNVWQVSRRADLEMLLPRLIKHMVIKAKHWQWLLDVWREKRGDRVTAEAKEALVAASKESRRTNVGPIKPKNHPTWAWLAGYLDGDGSYVYSSKTRQNGWALWKIAVSAVAHVNDRYVLDFLRQSFGGEIYPDHRSPALHWRRMLGYQNRSFAEQFLPKLAKHSRFKRDKIDAILHHHRQRLSIPGPERQFCGIEGCDRRVHGDGLCRLHRDRKKRLEVSDSLNA